METSGRKGVFVWSLSMASLLIPGTSSALDLSITPRLNTGILYYEFEQDPITFTSVAAFPSASEGGPPQTQIFTFVDEGFKLSAFMPFVGGGLTLFANRLFFDVYAQGAFSGEDDATETVTFDSSTSFPTDPVFFDAPFVTTRSLQSNVEFDRQEYSFTLGTAVTENIAVFAGYRLSKTDFEFNTSGTDTTEGLNDQTTVSPIQFKQNADFDQDGFFFGGALGTDILPDRPYGGFLTLNVAIAFLDGEVKGTTDFATPIAGGPAFDAFKLKGDTVGINVGLSWKGDIPVMKGLGYTVGIDGYRYDFDSSDPASADFSETVGRLTAGLSYTF